MAGATSRIKRMAAKPISPRVAAICRLTMTQEQLRELGIQEGESPPPGQSDAPRNVRAMEIPAELNAPEFIEAWGAWNRRHPTEPGDAAKVLNYLAPFGLQEATAAVWRCLNMNWKKIRAIRRGSTSFSDGIEEGLHAPAVHVGSGA